MSRYIFIVGFICLGFTTAQNVRKKDTCDPVVNGLQGGDHIEDINIPKICKIGKIAYHHSDGQLMLHFNKSMPYHVCVRKSKQFVLLDQLMTQVTETISVPVSDKPTDKKGSRRRNKTREYLCVHQTEGGLLNVMISPLSHFYICYIEYVTFPMSFLRK